jgi:hypothetical protein
MRYRTLSPPVVWGSADPHRVVALQLCENGMAAPPPRPFCFQHQPCLAPQAATPDCLRVHVSVAVCVAVPATLCATVRLPHLKHRIGGCLCATVSLCGSTTQLGRPPNDLVQEGVCGATMHICRAASVGVRVLLCLVAVGAPLPCSAYGIGWGGVLLSLLLVHAPC